MADPLPRLAIAETLVVPSGDNAASAHCNVALVAGSTPQLTSETHNLLRSRLLAACVLVFAAFLAFLVKHLFYLDKLQDTLDWTIFWVHAAITGVTGAAAIGLYRGCPISLVRLRIAEWTIFGGPALFFVLLQYGQLLDTLSATDAYVVPVAPPWFILIFTYALFVPNTWQRAAVVIGAMAAAPVILILSMWLIMPEFAQVLQKTEYRGYLLESTMIMAVAAMTATMGVHTIGSLRREAFKAKQFGQYRLKQLIGSGGMGEVYLAEHQLMKRPCAIKIIRPEKAGDPRMLARFEREVRATAKLSHWNTIEIFDYGRSDDGLFYYVMEYLPGLSLAELVERHGPLSPERAIHFLSETCQALAEAHAVGLIHRDLKPGNIFAAHRGGVFDVTKLLDFGLAKPLTDVDSADLTHEGAITGSPLFMSPEQALGDKPATAQSDLYSLGAVAYYLLTGRPPFDGDKPLKVMIAHAHDKVVPPSQLRPEIPEDLELVVLRCLAKEPEDRYQDAEALRAALADCTAAGRWTRETAARWWAERDCPDKHAPAAALETALASCSGPISLTAL